MKNLPDYYLLSDVNLVSRLILSCLRLQIVMRVCGTRVAVLSTLLVVVVFLLIHRTTYPEPDFGNLNYNLVLVNLLRT